MEHQSDTNTGKNAKKKPFKLTRQLIRLALNDGWTQREIAEKCRVQQSIVSAWSKGGKYATEAQLMPLLEVYGHKLRRNTFRMYWSFDLTTQAKTFFRVEGKIILSEVMFKLSDFAGKSKKKSPTMKLIVHHQGVDKFRVVIQRRLELEPPSQYALESDQDALWSAEILDQKSSAELISFLDKLSTELNSESPLVGLSLPFLLRQALMNHGFSVGGVVEYPAVW
ncbi:hypothetical protein [Atopomonas sediminilitoris]|uniref:hypothetical protein n=1 Tax=Atopomonas sediminilitoris TaxID=2919919 RepID=UPI001F4DA3D9|nr:hypothetical protein [Atopomonas sediminilitoris]MCJ8168620.1 hypothetical protein [Atopomonas sediminilitoris]